MGAQVQPVSVGVVERRDMRVLVSAIGTMSPRATAVVRAKVSGELLRLHFKEGDEVKAGQLLAEIDPRSFQASFDQIQGTLQRDQALLKNAQLDLQRYKELQAQDSIASQQVDTQAALVRQYQGTVAADQAQADAARLQLGYTRITAPIAGRLGLRQANGRDMPVELWDRELKRQLASGKLNALDNSIDIATGTVKAKAAFDNAQGRLFANQFVNVKLEVDRLEQALTVPATAVQNNYVYLVQGDGTVTQRRITVGVADGDRVSVKGELQPGDQVVVDGIDRLREGAKVTVIEADKVQKVDQAVQDASSQPRGMRNLPPDVRAKLATMNPDERKAYLQKLRAERAGQRNGGAPGGEGGAPAGQPPAGQSPAPSPGSPQPSPGPAVSPAPAATAPAGR
jgi:multidrug efflux system membrane fusion protein